VLNAEFICVPESPDECEDRASLYLANSPAVQFRAFEAMRRRSGEDAVPPPIVQKARQNQAFVQQRLEELHLDRGRTPGGAARKASIQIRASEEAATAFGKDLRQVVSEIKRPGVDRVQEYEEVFPLLSQYSHAGSGSLLSYMTNEQEHAAQEPELHIAILGLMLATKWLLQLYDLVSDTYDLKWTRVLADIHAALQEQRRRFGILI
jgi:hypothetical protein